MSLAQWRSDPGTWGQWRSDPGTWGQWRSYPGTWAQWRLLSSEKRKAAKKCLSREYHSKSYFITKDIEKRVAFSGIIDLSPSRQNARQGLASRNGRCPSLHAYPCKTPTPTIRLTMQESDITSL
ncbi:hypothetical protein AVEN_209007-1 [Araneus ventricosus]|uniref:Uncharacterized protein n=1 Tax=Araneus ventricosus TaxID=182803 RepID=A0A4Y2SAM6_ARAVE|nr:hypothetical protein AVEN_209007-1 [Araneus ventricosus]